MSILTRVLIVVAGATVFGGIPLLLTQYEDDASRVPAAWNLDYRRLSIQQIGDQLGPPQEGMAIKQFVAWTLPEPDGTRVLRVVCQAYCEDGDRPASVTYLFYRDRHRMPVRSKKLLPAPPAVKASTPPPGSAPPSAAP